MERLISRYIKTHIILSLDIWFTPQIEFTIIFTLLQFIKII